MKGSYVRQLGHDGIGDHVHDRVNDIGRGKSRVLGERARGIGIVDLSRVLDEGEDECCCEETAQSPSATRRHSLPETGTGEAHPVKATMRALRDHDSLRISALVLAGLCPASLSAFADAAPLDTSTLVLDVSLAIVSC